MTAPVIDIENAVVAYNGVRALDNLSLRVAKGECLILAGPNGAGKTTLLTVVNGFTRLNAGSVRVFGEAPSGSAAWRIRRRIGYVAQFQPMDSRMPISLRESVMTGLYGRLGWRRSPGSDEKALVAHILDLLRLTPLADRPLGKLSGGEMRRVMIPRALTQQPEIMLLDEPTASLDDASRDDILDLMAHLHRERNITLVWVTHDLDALPETHLRIARLRNGRLARETTCPTAPRRPKPDDGLATPQAPAQAVCSACDN